MTEINGYQLYRAWFDFAFDNPEKTSPYHCSLYFFAIEHCNRLGWKEKFGFPTTMAMEAIGIKSYGKYKKTLDDLVEWGFIKMIEKSKNQYSANIIALSSHTKAPTKALDKALQKHGTKHSTKHSTKQSQSTVSIDKQLNKEQITKNKYLDYVFLTKKEYEKLLKDFGEGKLKMCIEKLDEFIPNSKAAKSYTDHSRVLRGWVSKWFEDLPKEKKPKKKISEMTAEETWHSMA